MNRTISLCLMAVVCTWSSVRAIDPVETDLMRLLNGTTPTARSWGMAFSELASPSAAPSPTAPGQVGVWALEHNVYASHLWESPSSQYQEFLRFDISQRVYAVGVTAQDLHLRVPVPLAIGVLHRRTRSADVFYPGYDFSQRRRESIRDWVIAAGFDLGIQFGLGMRWNDLGLDTEFQDYHVARDWYVSYSLRLNFRHLLHRFGVNRRVLDFGHWAIDPSVSYAMDDPEDNRQHGTSYACALTVKSLPVAAAEYAISAPRDNAGHGWEICLLGTYAFRRGERVWPYSVYDTGFDLTVPLPDWSTEGHAVHSRGLQQWLAAWLRPNESSFVGWVMQNLSVSYETARFRHPERVSPEIRWPMGAMSVRQWSLQVDGLRALWDSLAP